MDCLFDHNICAERTHEYTSSITHARTHTCTHAPHTSYFLFHLRPYIQSKKEHTHMSFTPPPQQRWPLHLHLYSFSHPHTAEQGARRITVPIPPFIKPPPFIKLISSECIWKHVLELFTSSFINYYNLCYSNWNKNCEHSKGQTDNFNEVQGYLRKYSLILTVDGNVDYYIDI